MLETIKDGSDTFHKESTFSLDIKINGISNEGLAFCTQNGNIVSNKLILLCKPENKVSKNNLISLNSEKSDYSSITLTKAITEEILIGGEINNQNVGKKKFNGGEWSFEINVYDDYPTNSVIKIDLIYNEQKATGTCTFSEEKKFLCSPDVNTQNSDDIFTISPNKESGSVTFKDNEKISFNEYVKYLKAYDLQFINNVWKFKIKVESNIEDGTTVIIGVNVDNSPTTANCQLASLLLTCEISLDGQKISNEIQINNNQPKPEIKLENPNNIVDLYMNYEIHFNKVYGGFYNNQWLFYIYYDKNTVDENVLKKKVILDIKVHSQSTTALCIILSTSLLKCTSRHDNQYILDSLYIPRNKEANLGTISFDQDLSQDMAIEPLKLKIDYKSSLAEKNNNKLKFVINGELSNALDINIEEGTITEIQVIKDQIIDNLADATCLTSRIKKEVESTVSLNCEMDGNIGKEKEFYLYMDEDGTSKSVTFSQKEDILLYRNDNQDNGGNGGNGDKTNGNFSKFLDLSYLSILFLLFL